MAVTKLIKKAAKNKSRAKQRVRTIRQSLTRNLVASPYKEESGIVIGTVDEVIEGKTSASAPVEEKQEVLAEVETQSEVAIEENETETENTEASEDASDHEN